MQTEIASRGEPATTARCPLEAKELQTPLGVEAASWKNGLAHFGDEGPKPAPAKLKSTEGPI